MSETPPPELVGRRIVDAGVAIYGSREYLEGRSTTDLEALDWIGWESGSQMAFARWMSEHVPKARVRVRVSEGWAIRDAIDANVGVAVVPCALGETQAAWKRVRREPILTAPLWLLTHKDLRTTARVRVLREFVADAITSRRKTFIGR